jgi:hypothetical protein
MWLRVKGKVAQYNRIRAVDAEGIMTKTLDGVAREDWVSWV